MKKLSVLDREWEILLVLGEVSNLSRAADKLGIQQPTLSLALKKVEERLGFKVFIRSKVGLRPTSQGKELLESLAKVKDFAAKSLVSFSSEASSKDKELRGRIRFGMHKVLAGRFLSPLIAKLHKNYPAVDWDFDFSRSPEITRKVLNYECDIGIVVDPHPFPDLVIRNFSSDSVGLWGSPQLAKDCEIEELPLLLNPEMMSIDRIVSKLGFKRHWAIPDYFEIIKILKEVPSVALLPNLIASSGGKFKALDHEDNMVKIALIYRKERFESAALRELVRSIFDELTKASTIKS